MYAIRLLIMEVLLNIPFSLSGLKAELARQSSRAVELEQEIQVHNEKQLFAPNLNISLYSKGDVGRVECGEGDSE